MKNYDFKFAERYIQMRADQIETASLGMQEDWCWTEEEVFGDGKMVIDFDEVTEIAGISGSHWATPTLYVEYKDGREEFVDCFKGDSSGEKPAWLQFGVMSGPAQDWVESVKRPKITNQGE